MGVIKANDILARRVRPPSLPFAPLAPPPLAVVVDAQRVELERQVEALSGALDLAQQELQAQAGELSDARAQLDAAVEAAEIRGREAGRAEGAETGAEALLMLEAAAGRAVEQVRGELRGMETLAVALARAALAKVFGEPGEMAERVTRLVRHQLDSLDRAAVLVVEVSSADFPEADAVAALALGAGLQGIEAHALEALEPGDCRIRLKLGELEVGLGQQWGRLGALLDEALAAGETA